MWSVIANVGPYGLFLGMCLYEVVAYRRGKVISPGELSRIQAGHKDAIEVERRIAGYHERRAEIAEARADRADAALAKLNAELPSALHALARSNAGAT